MDLAVVNISSDSISIFLGNGSGGFALAPGSPFSSGGSGPHAITSADFNGDGIMDLAVVNIGSDSVLVFLGNGSGGFAPTPGSPFLSGGLLPASITSADFNGDGIMDLAVANQGSNNVSVFLGNGSGGFAPAPGSPFSSGGSSPFFITSADFNGDGIMDLAVANRGSNNVSVFLGNGSGGFAPAPGSPFSSGGVRPMSITAADFNGDGTMDLAVVNFNSDDVSVFLGDGSGAFTPAAGSPFSSGGSGPSSITAADFNGDGTMDLAVVNFNSDDVSFFLGNGSGGFTPVPGSPFSSGGSNPVSIISADFNGDGRFDLAIANFGSSTISILINTCVTVGRRSLECILVQKVYDWVVLTNRDRNKVPIPAECFTLIENCRSGGGLVTATCAEVEGTRRCDVLPGSRPAPNVPGGQIVTIAFHVRIRIEFFCDGVPLCNFEVPVNFVDEVILCFPEGTRIVCNIFDVNCTVLMDQMLGNMLLLEVVMCQDVQVKAEVKLEVEAKFCGPRQPIPIEDQPFECLFPTFPEQCPAIFPVPVPVPNTRFLFISNRNDNTIAIFDISTPTSPVLVREFGEVDFPGVFNGPTALAITGTTLYAANQGDDSVAIFDISAPVDPVHVGQVSTGLSEPTGLAITRNTLYIADQGDASGVAIYDISLPNDPVFERKFTGEEFSGALNSPTALAITGNTLYVSNQFNDNVDIFDISAPNDPIRVGQVNEGNLSGPTGLTTTGTTLYAANFNDSTIEIYDISLPPNPIRVRDFGAEDLSGPERLAITGTTLYATNFNDSTVEIYDISLPPNPIRVRDFGAGVLNGPFGLAILR